MCIQMADKEPNNPAKGHTVVAFLIFPTRHNSFNVDSLKGQAITKQLRYTCTHVHTHTCTHTYIHNCTAM